MIVILLLLFSATTAALAEPLLYPGEEKHLANVKQLTFGGENAEAYFSPDGKTLVFQSTRDSFACDQIFMMDTSGANTRLVSTGKGQTTCAFFIPGTDEFVYCSTHEHAVECPPKPDRTLGYVWSLAQYDVYRARNDGTNLKRLTAAVGYDAEAAVSPDGRRVIFTSTRDGDLEIYTMAIDGSDMKRLTWTVGYDGGAFFSPDGRSIVYRAFHPRSPAELSQWNDLWKAQAVSPVRLDLWVMDADGGNQRQVTDLGGANFCPYMSPDGHWIVFTSNFVDKDKKGMPNFDLYRVRRDGADLERITHSPVFEGFPMWSNDGKKLVFASNRGVRATPTETNIFIADWIE